MRTKRSRLIYITLFTGRHAYRNINLSSSQVAEGVEHKRSTWQNICVTTCDTFFVFIKYRTKISSIFSTRSIGSCTLYTQKYQTRYVRTTSRDTARPSMCSISFIDNYVLKCSYSTSRTSWLLINDSSRGLFSMLNLTESRKPLILVHLIRTSLVIYVVLRKPNTGMVRNLSPRIIVGRAGHEFSFSVCSCLRCCDDQCPSKMVTTIGGISTSSTTTDKVGDECSQHHSLALVWDFHIWFLLGAGGAVLISPPRRSISIFRSAQQPNVFPSCLTPMEIMLVISHKLSCLVSRIVVLWWQWDGRQRHQIIVHRTSYFPVRLIIIA